MSVPAHNRRADARRSRAAILDAAIGVLNVEPDAAVEAIAAAAGVTRQTVYAHFATRERLLLAVVDRITDGTVAAMDAAALDADPAAETLIRMLDAAGQAVRRYPALLAKLSALPVDPETDRERHAPLTDRIKGVIERGQRDGAFDDRLPADWLAAATIALSHAASEQQDAGRMSAAAARDALHTSLLRMLAATDETDRLPR